MWKVGHSLIKEKMKEEKALLAGEMSGHIFFAHRYFGFDDAIYAAARLCELLSQETTRRSPITSTALPKLFNTPEMRYELPDEIKFDVVRRVVEHVQGDGREGGAHRSSTSTARASPGRTAGRWCARRTRRRRWCCASRRRRAERLARSASMVESDAEEDRSRGEEAGQ